MQVFKVKSTTTIQLVYIHIEEFLDYIARIYSGMSYKMALFLDLLAKRKAFRYGVYKKFTHTKI